MKTLEELQNELYLSTTGYRTAIVIAPGGSMRGLDYGPALVEVVVLDQDGETVAYRTSNDWLDDDWQLGSPADAILAAQEYDERMKEYGNEE